MLKIKQSEDKTNQTANKRTPVCWCIKRAELQTIKGTTIWITHTKLAHAHHEIAIKKKKEAKSHTARDNGAIQ